MDTTTRAAYLARIGAELPAAPTAAALADLQRRHLRTVPFENLGIHLPGELSLDPADLAEKIITHRRGGFCFELNGLFAELLRAVGFTVTLAGARVFHATALGPPQDHLALLVTDEQGVVWLSDVGFGRFALSPLRWDSRAPQADAGGTFRLIDAGPEVEVWHGDSGAYRVDPRPLPLRDFAPMCWWHQTSPKSHFTRNVMVSLPLENGADRVTLSGHTLIRTEGDLRHEQQIEQADLLAAYRKWFGITLPHLPTYP
ncbi:MULTISPECIES: arylamine N-acetyltransferase [unclassified Crossiella]|uniref:arylamine N-acetyltransferase family protein n=1 Tax=unclassified Crossiella TaxID=2620835 RepID=UPI001FFF902A|nr:MULTISPECIES: arylamine N-acetyltransferase [unclassified Crossiella]MCK2244337.1 arylamine N-acetyltransferase [Crossiella sp. S99.2]MCK2257835.1 arylamine N-acetyltransferase [Crossiella sp. S99.1]